MKKGIFILICCTLVTVAKAQFSFISGIGLLYAPSKTLYVNVVAPSINNPVDSAIFSYDMSATGFNFLFYPKYHLNVESDNSSSSRGKSKKKSSRRNVDEKPFDISIGLPTMFGFGGIFNTGQGTQSNFMYNISLTADANFGNCKFEDESNAGFYAGLGFGVANTSQKFASNDLQVPGVKYNSKYKTINQSDNFNPSALGYGFNVRAGAQFGGGNMPQKFGLGGAYQIALNKNGLDYYTIYLTIPINLFGGINMF